MIIVSDLKHDFFLIFPQSQATNIGLVFASRHANFFLEFVHAFNCLATSHTVFIRITTTTTRQIYKQILVQLLQISTLHHQLKMKSMMEFRAMVNPIVRDKYVTVKLEYQWLEVTVIATFQA